MVVDRFKTNLPVLPLTVAASHFSLEVLGNILPLVYTLLIAERGFSYSNIGTIALVGGLFGSITQLLFGLLVDRWDARKQVVLSIVWMGLGMGIVGFVSNIGWLIVVVGFAKLASAAYHPAGAALASFAATKMKGASFSYFSVGGSIGSALCPLIFGLALGRWGLVGTVALIPSGILLAALLWSPLGRIPLTANKKQGNVEANKAGSFLALLPIIILVGTRSWTSGTFNTYLPEWFSSQGSSLALAGGAFSLSLISTAVGNLLGGRVADRIGHERVVIGGMLLLSGAFWCFMNLDDSFRLFFLAFVGIAVGMTTPSSIVMAQSAWPQAIGLASSLVMGVAWMPSSLGSWVIGLLADRHSLGFALSTLTYVPLIGVAVLGLSLWLAKPQATE